MSNNNNNTANNSKLCNAIYAKVNNAAPADTNGYLGIMFYRTCKQTPDSRFKLPVIGKTIALTSEQIDHICEYLGISNAVMQVDYKPIDDTKPVITKPKYIPSSDAYDNYHSSWSDDDECPFKEHR